MFSSTLSFLDNVAPSERFSPLENSLTTSRIGTGPRVKCSLSATSAAAGALLALAAGWPADMLPADHVSASVATASVAMRCAMRGVSTGVLTQFGLPCPSGQGLARRLHLRVWLVVRR